jgi:hypothetical protein
MIRTGTNRVVLLFPTFVLKVPLFWSWRRFVHGVMANYHEKELWKCVICKGSAVYDQRQYLAPVLWQFMGLLLCMRRTQVVPRNTTWPPVNTKLIPIDPNPANIGLYEGRVVLHDYGPLILSAGNFANLRDPDD